MSRLNAPEPLDRSERGGSIGMVLLIAGALLGAVLTASFVANDLQRLVIQGLVAVMAFIGVGSLFGVALGYLRVRSGEPRNDLTKTIVDHSNDATLVVGGDGRIIYANLAYFKLSGATSAETLKPVERLFSGGADVSEATYRLAQAAREGKSLTEELRLPPQNDGEPGAWYRVRVRPISLPNGRPATVWSVSDIGRDRERQESTFQELQYAIDFLDHAPAGFLSIEPSGEIIHINATLAGWLDRDLAEFTPGAVKFTDIVAGDGASLVTTVSGAPGELKTETIDLDLKHRNGRPFPVRLLHSVAFGHDGRPGASRTLVLNRSAGEDTAEGLRAAEVRFARFFNTTPMAIASVTRTGAIVQSNASFARLFSDAWKNVSGEARRSVIGCVADRDRDALTQAVAAAADGRTDVPPLDVTLTGDNPRTLRVYVAAGEVDPGSEERATLFALDTTEQRALEAQFAQAQKMQAVGQLAGGIAHDFNNVLQAIIGYSDLLLANHRPTDPSFPDIMQIKHNANRAAGLVRQLLAFSRRQTLRPRTIALGDALADLSVLLKRLIGEKVELDLKHGRDLWFVKADLNQLEQVIVNLAVNARDAMPEGGRLSIRTANLSAADIAALEKSEMPLGDFVLLEVSDTGTGIPAEIRDKIFEPFFTTKEVGKGTGLGLSTVYGIVKQTGGFIYVDSAVGKGTTFRIYLPRAEAEEETPAKGQQIKAPAADVTGSGTVLLVEDEEAVRAFAARALSARGYKVLVAASGAEALDVEQSHNGRIDLVLSDVVMPEVDGPTMLKELRKRRKDFKVIFMSGHAEDAFEKSLDRGEVFAFIAKPFSLKDLVETVKKTMAA